LRCACGFAAAPAHALATPSRAALELSIAGKRTLRPVSVTSAPRGPSKFPTLAISDWTIGSSARIGLFGSLRFSAGRRSVSAGRLAVTISRTSSYVTARIGASSVRLFALTPTRPTVLDATAQHASLVGARVALTRAAATALKKGLKLRRAPSTKTLGKLTVGVAAELGPTPLPARAPVATPTPVPTASPAPEPGTPCAERFGATPAGSVDWFGCDLPGNGDLHSWTDYVQRPFPALPGCGSAPGTVVAAGGGERIVTAYDHRFPIALSAVRPDGSATIVVNGSVTYTMPAHGIDEQIGALRIEIAPGGQTGTVYASGHAKPRDMGAGVCATAPAEYADQPVLTLDLTGIAPVSGGGVTRWVHVPAKISAAGNDRIGGGVYGAGAAWGAFTIAIPER
jgi:Htaa